MANNKNRMLKYYVEYEIERGEKNIYWLPLIVEGVDKGEIDKIIKSIEDGLGEFFTIRNRMKPTIYIHSMSSEFMKKYIKSRMGGDVKSLIFYDWKILDLDVGSIHFDENITLRELASVLSQQVIARGIKRNEILVRVLREDNPDELPIVNVFFKDDEV
jgi:hypothetical protein